MKYSEWAESFTIFAKYGDGFDVAAEHDEMWAGPQATDMADEDVERLVALNWQVEVDGGFHHFV